MTAIRTIEYTASPSGVKPIAPQDAGVRGEHKATNVVFNLDASLIKPEYKYRFEYVDGFSGFDTTEFVQPVGSTVSILLPVEWTAGGGCGTLRLCIVALDSQSDEEQTVYTFPASLLFAERETGGECNYKKGLSALIDSAGKATDAANEAAESANAAADKVDEAVSSANAATANANRAAASADASAATASAAAGGAQEAKEAADTAASGANTAAEQARTAAASANTAAGTADTAASNANAVADAVQAKLDAGELKGEKGDTGPEGPQGVSGVYVGGGDMPEGYTVQVDPTGDMLCYTAGESDDRYANVLTGTASGPVAALEDVSPTGALRRAAVLGATAETGSGDKGPDNPYTLAGVQPTKVTVCGRNLAANPRFNAADQFSPCVYADCELQPNTKYTISLYVPAGEAYYTNTCSRRLFICLYQPVAYIVRKPPQSLQYRIPIQSNTPQAKAGLCLKHNLVRPLPATRGICKSNLATPPPLMSRIPAKPSRCPRWPPCTATEPCATNTTWFRAWKPGGGSGWCSTGRRTGDCPVPSPETIDILSGCRGIQFAFPNRLQPLAFDWPRSDLAG